MPLDAGTVRVPAAPITGTFTLANDTSEQTILEVIAAPNTSREIRFVADTDAITKNNFRMRLYVKIDGINYRAKTVLTLASTDSVAFFFEEWASYDVKMTAQSAAAEGATRAIPYTYTVIGA